MRSILASIVLILLLAGSSVAAGDEENCRACHRTAVSGAHQGLACSACHGDATGPMVPPSAAGSAAAGCVGCHEGYGAVFEGPMGHRRPEKAFADAAFGAGGAHFFEQNCASCHLADCLDCHGGDGHAISAPQNDDCLACHRGYFVGREYLGMAPREDHLRYQRGPLYQGEPFLKMLPDLHSEIGMECADCHTMESLAAGQKSARVCTDCHQPDPQVIEHSIGAHLEQLECYACHSAWAPQEYGTFFLKFVDSDGVKNFRLRKEPGREVLKSAYLKRQDAPPLGLNGRGRVSPIRPAFIAYYTETRGDEVVGEENRLLAARWKAFFPHTVRSGTVMCEGCHDNRRRFVLEKDEERIYYIEEDGLGLRSFWNRQGQQVKNGAFFPAERFERMARKGGAYTRAYVEKWKNLVDRVEGSSRD